MPLNSLTYLCPIHGKISEVIISQLPDHEGKWCAVCWMEALDKLGVQQVVKSTWGAK